MLESVKLALRISTNAFDDEISDLIDAALLDLGVAGVDNALIHDKMADTVCVDLASQMIFPDRETMIDYKEKMHAEKVAREAY